MFFTSNHINSDVTGPLGGSIFGTSFEWKLFNQKSQMNFKRTLLKVSILSGISIDRTFAVQYTCVVFVVVVVVVS